MMKPLIIGDLVAKVPIVQGGMGIGVSLASLAGAVAKEGGIGVLSAAQPGYLDPEFKENPLQANLRALTEHIKRAKELSGGGIIGVNIMRASKGYATYVKHCCENGADLIISGAGLPLELPMLVAETKTKFAPIVSSLKAVKVLFKMWDKKYATVSDMLIIEGPKAGGHLGFTPEDAESLSRAEYDAEIVSILEYVKEFEVKYDKKIPVVFGGGVFDRADIDHYLNLGCAGVQMATRFVATEECDADIAFKQAYVDAKEEDIVIVKSPVGMPGRAIENTYMAARKAEKEQISHCYQCLEKCNPAQIPYCISGALMRAATGDVENSLVFCGENAYKIDRITTVHEIFAELTKE